MLLIQQVSVHLKLYVQDAEKVMVFQMIRHNVYHALLRAIQVTVILQDKTLVTNQQLDAHTWMKMDNACKVVLRVDILNQIKKMC